MRNRQLVVNTMLDLYLEGNLRPGAQEVAERCGLSRRSVFRYFEDLDDLRREAIGQQFARVQHLLPLPGVGQGPLAGRIDQIAAQRVRLYEALAPVARVARLSAPFQPLIHQRLDDNRRFFAWQVELQFAPELKAARKRERAELLAATDAVCSFEFFEHLSAGRGMTPIEIRRVLGRSLTALFGMTAAAKLGRVGQDG